MPRHHDDADAVTFIFCRDVVGVEKTRGGKHTLYIHAPKVFIGMQFLEFLEGPADNHIVERAYTLSRLLPFFLRLAKTCLPALVDMRRRNPCFLLRLRLETLVIPFFMKILRISLRSYTTAI